MYGYDRAELLQLCNMDLSAEPESTRQAIRDERPIVSVRYHKKKGWNSIPSGNHRKSFDQLAAAFAQGELPQEPIRRAQTYKCGLPRTDGAYCRNGDAEEKLELLFRYMF